MDRGLRPGVSTAESVELAAPRRRMRELETEIAVTKRANARLKDRKGHAYYQRCLQRGKTKRQEVLAPCVSRGRATLDLEGTNRHPGVSG